MFEEVRVVKPKLGEKLLGKVLPSTIIGIVALLGYQTTKATEETPDLLLEDSPALSETLYDFRKSATLAVSGIQKLINMEKRRQFILAKERAEQRRLAQIETWDSMPLSELSPEQEIAIIDELDMAAWSKVSICEQGGDWTVSGSKFSGGLGIMNSNWDFYGRGDFGPSAATASPVEQVAVARRIQEENGVSRDNVPNQTGCGGGW